MREIKHTIYFQSEESKKDFLDFAYSEDFTKAWDKFDEEKKNKEQPSENSEGTRKQGIKEVYDFIRKKIDEEMEEFQKGTGDARVLSGAEWVYACIGVEFTKEIREGE